MWKPIEGHSLLEYDGVSKDVCRFALEGEVCFSWEFQAKPPMPPQAPRNKAFGMAPSL